MSYKISKISKNEDGSSEVVISGQLVVTHASKIKADLEKIKFKTSKANLVINEVEDIDLSMVQLIKAFVIANNSNDIEVLCDFQLNEDLQVLLQRSGILEELNQ